MTTSPRMPWDRARMQFTWLSLACDYQREMFVQGTLQSVRRERLTCVVKKKKKSSVRNLFVCVFRSVFV